MPYSMLMWGGYEPAPHLRLIAKKLEQVARGEISRLMIFTPPRHGKSQLVSTFFPPWFLGNNPDQHIIFTSYSSEVASDYGRKVKNLMLDPLHQRIFGGISIASDSASSRRFHTDKGGVYYAVGIEGAITSRGAHIAIIDDIIKNKEEAESPVIRKKTQEWYTSVLYTRLMPAGRIVIVNTRWHEDDLCGWLLKQPGDKWDLLSLPAIDTEGNVLWPDRYPLLELERIKVAIGTRDFEALYQQNPTPTSGTLIQRGWWKFYKELPSSFDECVIACDATFKNTASSDFVVICVWGKSGGNFYLIDQLRKRMDFPTTRQAFKAMIFKHAQASTRLIEEAANGVAIIQSLQEEIPGIIGVRAVGTKVARASAVSPMIESGNCYLPEPSACPWISDYLSEFDQFPFGQYDDQVDATVHALSRLSRTKKLATFGDALSITKGSQWT